MSGKSTTIRFVLSSALSLLGNSVAGIVFPLILLAITGDPLAAGTLAIVCAIPQVAAGVLGGVILDRFNRRNVSIISDLISAASVAMLPIIDMTVGLSFGWFVLFGIIGAIGDIPGMTARDTLLPAVTKHDRVDMQSFMGVFQSLQSFTMIIGPALAALLMGVIGSISALWITAIMSLLAALVTMTLPRVIGAVKTPDSETAFAQQSLAGQQISSDQNASPIKTTLQSLKDGLSVLFKSDGIITASLLLSFGIIMVLGSYQGLVLPVFFTELNQPELLGYTLSMLSLGMLVGSLAYAALAARLKKRTWYVISLVGMAGGIVILGSLASFPIILVGAFFLGALAGPVSALLGFFVIDRIPEEKRGVALGTQNSLLLVVAPIAIFASSVIVSVLGTQTASWILVGAWILIVVFALAMKSMKKLDDPAEEAPDTLVEQAVSPAE